MENIGQLFLWVLLLGCVLPALVLLVLGVLAFWFGRKWIEDFIEPNSEKMHEKYLALKQKHPQQDDAALIGRVINREALRCGLVGAVTGLGGFITLPFSLPIDILLSARIQAQMVSFIAQFYGYDGTLENQAATYAVLASGGELSKFSIGIVQRYLPRLISKSFSKLIPFLGALLGFLVNYGLAQSTGRLAVRWYENKAQVKAV